MIHARGYRPYLGTYLPPNEAAVRAIALSGLRRPWKGRWFKLVLLLSQVPAVVFGVMLYLQAQLSKDLPIPPDALGAGGPADPTRMGPAPMDDAMRMFIDARYLLHQFLTVQMWSAVVLIALLAGADGIAGDIRANAMPLYFSRPVTRTHYLAGRLLPVAAYLGLVTLAPALALLVARLAFTADPAAAWKALPVAAPLLGGAAIVAAAVSLVVLACSAAGGRNWVARAAFVLVWFLPAAATAAVHGIAGTSAAGYLSPANLLASLLASLFGQAAPLHPAGAAAALAAMCAGAIAFLYLRLGRAAELR
jgi:hypothetical protein